MFTFGINLRVGPCLVKILSFHALRMMIHSQFIWNTCLVAQSTNYFKNMAPLRNLSYKTIPGKLFLGLLTYMEEIQCIGGLLNTYGYKLF